MRSKQAIRIHFLDLTKLAFVLISAAATVPAQERTGQVNGTATDATGSVLPNVVVSLTNRGTTRSFISRTSAEGVYLVRDLEPGRYSVRFELKGFDNLAFANVWVPAGKVLTLDAVMKLSGTQQELEVTGVAPLIDTTTAVVAHNVAAEEFVRLPKTRSFQSMANTAPNVNVGEVVEGGIQINGASGAENQFNVDGMSTTSLIEGHSRQNAIYETLEEVQVKTAGIEAQYGGALGGVISAITKSGGNTFHGDVHYYFNGTAIAAGPPKRLYMDPVSLTQVSYQQDSKDSNRGNEIGYSLGGYFIKNRLYFFSSASPRLQNRNREYLSVDLQRVRLNADSTFHQAYNKVSADIARNLRASAAFLWTPSSAAGTLANFNGVANQVTSSISSIEANGERGYFSPQSNYNVTIDWALNPTSLLTIKGARFWDNHKGIGVPDVSPIVWGQPSTDVPAIPRSLSQPEGFATIPAVPTTAYDIAARNLLQADFSKFLKLAGGHDVKVGIGRQKNVNRVNTGVGGGGLVTLNWGSQLTLPSGQTVSGTYGYYQFDEHGTIGSTGGTIDHLYFQDRWRIGGHLSLDLGVRFEREVIPSFRRDVKEFAFQFGWGSKIAPRLGASYDLFGDARFKLYASWGIFYDWVKYELARGTFGGDVWRTYYRPIDSLDPNIILKLGNRNLPGRNLWPTEFQDWRIPAFGKEQLDPDIRPMSSMLVNAGLEWQLGAHAVLAARYTRNALRDTIEDIGTLIGGSEVYIYGNPGRGLARMSAPSTATPSFELPRPKRVYDGIEVSFTRRFGNRWFAAGSYVLSRLYGNYAGLQNSDEILPAATNGLWSVSQSPTGSTYRPGTSASRAYDLDTYVWDSHGRFVYGRLASDRPHVLKIYGSYTLPTKYGNTEVGGFFYAGSGTPISTLVQDVQNVPLFVEGRGDLGRTPMLNFTNLLVAHEVKIGESKRIRFEFNADNLFSQKTSRYTYPFYNRFRERSSGIIMNDVDLRKGYDWRALVAASADAARGTGAQDPRFGYADNFSAGFEGRLGIKLLF
ncbi:MAG: TonB-dependent receptor [Bryobacterales bacterium]|nr:TonB-dependent receptor [Bryobacterales bacterium]